MQHSPWQALSTTSATGADRSEIASLPRKSSGYIQGSTTGADRSEIGPYLTRPSIRPCYVRDRGSTETAKP
jgi:hypothetical protein